MGCLQSFSSWNKNDTHDYDPHNLIGQSYRAPIETQRNSFPLSKPTFSEFGSSSFLCYVYYYFLNIDRCAGDEAGRYARKISQSGRIWVLSAMKPYICRKPELIQTEPAPPITCLLSCPLVTFAALSCNDLRGRNGLLAVKCHQMPWIINNSGF